MYDENLYLYMPSTCIFFLINYILVYSKRLIIVIHENEYSQLTALESSSVQTYYAAAIYNDTKYVNYWVVYRRWNGKIVIRATN